MLPLSIAALQTVRSDRCAIPFCTVCERAPEPIMSA